MTADQKPTLTVFSEGVPIFTSHGHWLCPLFELEAYLAEQSVEPARLLLEDTIIGKAAAALIHRLGFRTVKTGILSRLGEVVFQRHQIVYTYAQLVERIHCQTEAQLASVRPFSHENDREVAVTRLLLIGGARERHRQAYERRFNDAR